MGEQDHEKSTKNEAQKAPATGGDGGGKKDGGPITAVLKLDLHCEGCAKKVKRTISHFEGIETVKADFAANKLTVVGAVDPAALRERVEYKTKKKVELLSPQPKKDGGADKKDGGADKKDGGAGKKDGGADKKDGGADKDGGAGKKTAEEKPDQKKEEDKKAGDDKKPKEAVVSTVAMKIWLHCDGCAHKIKRLIKKHIDGVNSVTIDLQKDMVTVVGTMNVKEVASLLKEKLKRAVEIVPPKKNDAGGDKKQKEPAAAAAHAGGGSDEHKKKEGGGGDHKQKHGVGGDEKAKAVSAGGLNKMEFQSYAPSTYYAMPMYNQSYANQDYGVPMFRHHHHPGSSSAGYMMHYMNGPPPPPPTYIDVNDQMFSDENPNGCFVM